MAPVVRDGFTLDPPGYERLSQRTHILMHIVNARANFESVRDHSAVLGDLQDTQRQHAAFVAGVMAYCRRLCLLGGRRSPALLLQAGRH